MRGDDPRHDAMFSYVTPEARVRSDHPLRPIRKMTDAALERLSPRFDRLYSTTGRPSIPPEKLLRALLLQVLYSIRSERLLMEELDYNILYRWFVGLSLDDPIWDATTFTKNRDRLLSGDIADAFFAEVLAAIKAEGLISDEHFTVDGTLLEAWASHKSFKPKGTKTPPPDDPKNPTVNFHGEARRNDTHHSTTDPDARLYKKAEGREAKLAYLGHLLTENRHGFIVDTAVTAASGTAERDAAIVMLGELPLTTRRLTVGADKNYDTRAWVRIVRTLGITPHVAQNDTYRRSAIDQRTTRQPGYAVSQRCRKKVEQPFGWMKTVGLLRKLRHRGGRLVDWIFSFTAAAYNLIRWRNLAAQPA
ncbi:MAG: IS5 family transposase [Vicinamibacterales bacterium]